MAEKKNNQVPKSNVVPLHSAHCKAEKCKKPIDKADFCKEHYAWFKEGLITKEGTLAKDFDKKYQHFLKRRIAA
jgi:hypothetical protein